MPLKHLVVSPAWLGDIIMAQSLLRALKLQNPSIVLDVLVPRYYAPLMQRMPEVNRVIELSLTHGQLHLMARYRMGRVLRGCYQQAFVLPNSWKSALIPFWAQIPKRTGWLGEYRWGLLNDVRGLNKKQYPKMVDRYLALAYPEHTPTLPTLTPVLKCDAIAQSKLLDTWQRDPKKRPVIALCPGAAFGPAKRWPLEYFSDLAALCLQAGWEVWLFGASAEQAFGTTIEQMAPDCLNLIGKTTLTDMIDWLGMADVAVCNDSGLMHMAAAVQTAVVAIYGSTAPTHSPPLTSKQQSLVTALPCQPCWQRQCRYHHYRCLTEIKPKAVWHAILQQLQA